MTTPKQRNHAFDLIKIVATTVVICCHYQYFGWLSFDNHINFYFSDVFDASLVVELFFMISGFLSYRDERWGYREDKRFGDYLGPKLYRLLPAMIVSAAGYLLASYAFFLTKGKFFYGPDAPNVWGMIVSGLGLSENFGFFAYNVNPINWYVSALITCYVLYYLLSMLAHKKRWHMQWMLVGVMLITLWMRENKVWLPMFGNTNLRGYQCFSMGLLLAWFGKHYRITKPLVALCVSAIGLVWGFICFANSYIDSGKAFVFLVCPALIILAQTQTINRLCRHAVIRWLSDVSYSVYLWHVVVQILLYILAYDYMHAAIPSHMYVFIAICWAVGAAMYYLVERPLRKRLPLWMKALFPRKD